MMRTTLSTRRVRLGAAALAAVVLLLPGCGGEEEPATNGAGAPAASEGAQGMGDGASQEGSSLGGAAAEPGSGSDPAATQPPSGGGDAIGGGDAGTGGPAEGSVTGKELCTHMKKVLPTLQQSGSPEMARAQFTMSLGSLYGEAGAIEELTKVDLDGLSTKNCPKIRQSVLKTMGQKQFGKL